MAKFAFCDVGNRIRQYDAATPSQLPVPVYTSAMNTVDKLALTSSDELFLCGGPYSTAHVEIHKVTGAQKTEEVMYVHPDPIWCVKVRSVAGTDRIYFSAGADFTPEGHPQRYDIYYLKPDGGGYAPVLYTSIDPTQLTFQNPCTGFYDMYWYRGDFVFGDSDILYLSTGPLSGAKVGVYRIDGAGPDTVTGTVQRIHEGDGPITALCYESPQTLYFLRSSANTNDVWKVDLGANTETLVCQFPLSGPEWASDLAIVHDTMWQGVWWWVVPSLLSKWLNAAAAYVVRLAELVFTGKPTPHPEPQRGQRPQ